MYDGHEEWKNEVAHLPVSIVTENVLPPNVILIL
jgi:hypothetical protein